MVACCETIVGIYCTRLVDGRSPVAAGRQVCLKALGPVSCVERSLPKRKPTVLK
jgi:hypothetical protein